MSSSPIRQSMAPSPRCRAGWRSSWEIRRRCSMIVWGRPAAPGRETGIARIWNTKRDRQHRVAARRQGRIRLAARRSHLPAFGSALARHGATDPRPPREAVAEAKRGRRAGQTGRTLKVAGRTYSAAPPDVGRRPHRSPRRLDRRDQVAGRNGFCRQTTSASSGDLARKSSAVIPEIATTGKSGTRSRIVAIRSEPLEPCRKISTIARSSRILKRFKPPRQSRPRRFRNG